MIGQKEVVFDRPMTPSEIQNAIYSCFSWADTIHAVLQQEVVLYCKFFEIIEFNVMSHLKNIFFQPQVVG